MEYMDYIRAELNAASGFKLKENVSLVREGVEHGILDAHDATEAIALGMVKERTRQIEEAKKEISQGQNLEVRIPQLMRAVKAGEMDEEDAHVLIAEGRGTRILEEALDALTRLARQPYKIDRLPDDIALMKDMPEVGSGNFYWLSQALRIKVMDIAHMKEVMHEKRREYLNKRVELAKQKIMQGDSVDSYTPILLLAIEEGMIDENEARGVIIIGKKTELKIRAQGALDNIANVVETSDNEGWIKRGLLAGYITPRDVKNAKASEGQIVKERTHDALACIEKGDQVYVYQFWLDKAKQLKIIDQEDLHLAIYRRNRAARNS